MVVDIAKRGINAAAPIQTLVKLAKLSPPNCKLVCNNTITVDFEAQEPINSNYNSGPSKAISQLPVSTNTSNGATVCLFSDGSLLAVTPSSLHAVVV